MAVRLRDRETRSLASAATPTATLVAHGQEWIVDARGCDADALRDEARLRGVFDRLIADLRLTPVAPAVWHRFPAPGGLTGVVVLAESHLACHTFPEHRSLCLNLFCCRPRGDFDVLALLADTVGATDADVRRIDRTYGSHDRGDA